MSKHLIVDLKNCNQLLNLTDMESIYELLNKISKIIGEEHRFNHVDVWHPESMSPRDQREYGITGASSSRGSHVSIHTYPERQYVFFDAFSIEDFNVDAVVAEVSKWFGSNDFDVDLITRGKGLDET